MAAATTIAPPQKIPAGANSDGDGIVLGSGPVTVDAYIDFLCPFCRQFESNHGAALDEMVAQGLISLVYHPLGYLDRLSTTRYSTRAAAASGCASDGGKFHAYKNALFANQPPEGGPGLSDDELVALGFALELREDFARCVMTGAHLDWAAYVTARALERGISGTPSVLVEGVSVPANARTIALAVQAAMEERGAG